MPRYYGVRFARWALNAELARFAYTGVDALGDIRLCTGQMIYRWSDAYRRYSLSLVYSFAESLPQSWDIWFLTLTVRHPTRHTYVGQCRAIDDLRASWALFRQNIRDFRYLRVYEAGESNGYAHIHMILASSPSQALEVEKLPEKWIEKCRKIGNNADILGQNIQKCDDVHNVGAYISKYLSKTLETASSAENSTYWRWIEVCYRLRLRCVAMDAVSRQYVKVKYARAELCGSVFGAWMRMP